MVSFANLEASMATTGTFLTDNKRESKPVSNVTFDKVFFFVCTMCKD